MRTHTRRTLSDGTTFDLTAYDEYGLLISFVERSGDAPVFIDFSFYDRAM